MPPGMVQRSLPHKIVLTAAVLAYSAGLLCLLVQFFPRVSLFEMAVSFLPLISLAGLAVTLALFRYHPRVSLVGLVFVAWVAWPFVGFSKFAAPTEESCEQGDCLTLIVANLYQSEDALTRLADLSSEFDPDIIALVEPPLSAGPLTYPIHFPALSHIVHVDQAPRLRRASIPLSLISRQPFVSAQFEIPDRSGLRSYIQADLDGVWEGLRIVATHPHIPISTPGLNTRNTLLRAASDVAAESETFILIGDFNLTPWSPKFQRLPGNRAGDPRFIRTWPVAWGALGIPIDHIMISENLDLVETRVLPPTGSDHRAILAKIRLKPLE